MTDQHIKLARLAFEAVITLVLLAAMTWIVLSPTTTDEASKAALVVVSSATGFLFGRRTTAG